MEVAGELQRQTSEFGNDAVQLSRAFGELEQKFFETPTDQFKSRPYRPDALITNA